MAPLTAPADSSTIPTTPARPSSAASPFPKSSAKATTSKSAAGAAKTIYNYGLDAFPT
jgi:hypothetical protein